MPHIAPAKAKQVSKKELPLGIIVIASGFPYTSRMATSPSLFRLGNNRTLIETQLHVIKKAFPDAELIVVVGYQSTDVINVVPYYARIIENERFYQTCESRSLALALRASQCERHLVIHGEMFFTNHDINITNLGYSNTPVRTDGSIRRDAIGVNTIDYQVQSFGFGLSTKWSQIVYLEGLEAEILKYLVYDKKHDKLFMFEILNKLLQEQGTIRSVENRNGKTIEIHSSKDLLLL